MRTLLLLASLALCPLSPAYALENLSWLDGCWRLSDARGEITEVWSAPPNAPVAFGYSVTRRDGAIVSWEQMRVEASARVNDAYIAMPQGGDPVRFARVMVVPVSDGPSFRGHLEFENLAHDFPQRIIYRGHVDQLDATVSASDGARENYLYRRIDCSIALTP